MPWPFTVDSETPIPFADQISSPSPEGLDANSVPGADGEGIPMDPATGVLAPGVLSAQDNPFDLVETQLAQEQAKKEAEAISDDGTEAKGKRALVIKYAEEALDKPYKWGAIGPNAFDCSGLLYMAFKKAGIDMPRVSMAQARRGKRVAISQLQAGDLVAWENNPRQSGADHIAIYLGNGKVLEAAHAGTNVRIRELKASETNAWGVHLDY